jgi:4'-phosphopantetheinyl transferase
MDNQHPKKGTILLKRKEKNFVASFCFIKKGLPHLIKDLSFLHPDEEKYYYSLKFDPRKASYLLGRNSAKQAIYQLTGIEDMQSIFIDFGIFQFPIVKGVVNQNIQVCISHCEDMGISVAYPEDHPLGIDIERINPNKTNVLEQHISVTEQQLLLQKNIPPCTGYTIIWTIKEALSKIFRTGLTMDFKQVEINSFQKKGAVYTSDFRNYAQYKAISCHSGNYVCSLILPKNTTPDLTHFWNSFTSLTAQ